MELSPPEIEKFITLQSPVDQHAIHASFNVRVGAVIGLANLIGANACARRDAGDLQERRRSGVGSHSIAARRARRMRAVIDLVCWVRAVAQSGRISAGTIQNTEQLVRFGGAVAAVRIVGKGRMGRIQARVEHGNDNAFALGAGAAAVQRCHPKSDWLL